MIRIVTDILGYGGDKVMAVSVRRMAAPLGALLLLGGCISLEGKAPEQLISLTAGSVAPAGASVSGKIGEALVVLDPDTDRRLDVQRVPVQIDDSRIAYLKDAAWVERPARQFRRLLAETIRARGGRLVVEGSDAEVAGKTVLSGRLLDMGYDARSQSVVVRYDALRENGAGTVESRRFEAVIPGVEAKAAAVAPALNTAANDVAAQVAEWVG
jgi:cholesterol transport system auxiliary component